MVCGEERGGGVVEVGEIPVERLVGIVKALGLKGRVLPSQDRYLGGRGGEGLVVQP